MSYSRNKPLFYTKICRTLNCDSHRIAFLHILWVLQKKVKWSQKIQLCHSLAEKSEDGEMVMEPTKLEETNGKSRGESISPPLADSNDDMEEIKLTD